MIGVTFALPAESSEFVRRLKNVRRDGAIVRGIFESRASNFVEICVLHTGVGARECEKRLGPFLDRQTLRILIGSGFCGGTNDEVAPGDLVIAQNYSDPNLAQQAKESLPATIVGRLFSADSVVDPAIDRYAIGLEQRAVAIDMETDVIARMCASKNVPMLSLRVVSDSPAAPFPAPPHVLFDLETQRTKFSRLLAQLAREPSAAIRFVRFSKQIAVARHKLAEALCAVIPAM